MIACATWSNCPFGPTYVRRVRALKENCVACSVLLMRDIAALASSAIPALWSSSALATGANAGKRVIQPPTNTAATLALSAICKDIG